MNLQTVTKFKQQSFVMKTTVCFQNSCTERTKASLHQRPKNEIFKEMSWSIPRDLAKSIKNADFHSIRVDETPDVSNKQQAVYCDYWVMKTVNYLMMFFLQEGLYEMKKTDVTIIVNFTKDIILWLSIDNEKLQASTMTAVLQW